QVENVLAFDPASPGGDPVPVPAGETMGMFASGVSAAVSADLRFFAQSLQTPRESGIAAIRVGALDRPDWPGQALATALRPGCGYLLPKLPFSPGGDRIAASFDCPPRWGTISSALVVWDIEDRRELARVPTQDEWRQIVWLDESSVV